MALRTCQTYHMFTEQSKTTLLAYKDEAQVDALHKTINNQFASFSKDLALQRAEFSGELAVLRAELENAITNSKIEAIKAGEVFVFQMFWALMAFSALAIALAAL
jgi:recombinational DNA repair ATPase RecF